MANVAALKHWCPAFLGSALAPACCNPASPSLAMDETGNEEVSRASTTEHLHYMAITARSKSARNGKTLTNGATKSHSANGSTQDCKLPQRAARAATERSAFACLCAATGIEAEIAQAFNACVQIKQHMLREIIRVSRVVGREGRVSERAVLPEATGGWKDQAEAYNHLIDDLDLRRWPKPIAYWAWWRKATSGATHSGRH